MALWVTFGHCVQTSLPNRTSRQQTRRTLPKHEVGHRYGFATMTRPRGAGRDTVLMKKIIAAVALAFVGVFTTANAVAHADAVEVEGSYATVEACRADGPHVHLAVDDAKYPYWSCQQGDDGYWHVWNSTNP
jgi:hypothetical protein